MIPEQANRFGRKRDETPTAEEFLSKLNQPLPFAMDAEQGVLSSIIQEPSRMLEARLKMQPQAFYHEANRTVFEELLTMDQEGAMLDPILLTNRLRDQGKLDRIGGPSMITELFTFTPVPSHFGYYMKIVRSKWMMRREIHGHLMAIDLCFGHGKTEQDLEVESVLNDCDAVLALARDGVKIDLKSSATLTQCLAEHVQHMQDLQEKKDAGQMPLISTGFPTLDRTSGGIAENEYWLVTGPTKAGKSILAGNIVKHAANKGCVSKIYTNEVQRVAYAGRFLASESQHFDGAIERHGFDNRNQMDHYSQAVRTLTQTIGSKVIIDNAAGKYVEDIVADIRMEAQKGVRLFIVDLIGKLRSRAPSYSRENELAGISNRLADATKTFGVAIIAVAQENDDGAVRESKALAMDCEAWLKLAHVYKEPEKKMFGAVEKKPEMMRDQRRLIVEVARGFASGDSILCHFNGARFLLAEMTR